MDTPCETWNARFAADYPHLPATAARVPTLLAYGGKDEYRVPPLMECVVNRLAADGTFGAGHGQKRLRHGAPGPDPLHGQKRLRHGVRLSGSIPPPKAHSSRLAGEPI
jgi:hypothetical protein